MKPLPLEHLMGEPLRAMVEAHGMAAHAISDFIMKAGFEPADNESKQAQARMFEFSYVQPVPDPTNPGGVLHTPVKMQIPVLSLLQVPALGISEGEISFEANVQEADKVSIEERTAAKLAPASPQNYVLHAVYAEKVAEPRLKSTSGGSLSVTLKIAREPMADGLSRVVSVLQDAAIATPVHRNGRDGLVTKTEE